MTPIITTQRELLLPLIEGIHESPPWQDFLKHLVAQTYARRAFLMVTLANSSSDQEPAVVQVAAPRAAAEAPLDFRRFKQIGLNPYGSLRSGRVYSLDELLDYSRGDRVVTQRAELEDMGARYGRFIRISAGGAADAWLLLVRQREDFSAAAVAMLSSVAPPFAAALKTLVALVEQRLQVAMARNPLRKLGIGQLAFDGSGRIMAADPQAEEAVTLIQEPDPSAGRRLQIPATTKQTLDNACAQFAQGAWRDDVPILIDPSRNLWLLLGKADLPLAEPCARPAAIGTLRMMKRENAQEARRALAVIYGLSVNEAALAHQLTLGKSIVEAGASLSLTAETSRNYSKRIYAKTGTRSQADLVRLVLTGLAPLT